MGIKTLPGMMRAAVGTLDKIWRADIDLSSSSHPRLKALAALERNVLIAKRRKSGPEWPWTPPALAAETHDMQADYQMLHHETCVASEAGPARHWRDLFRGLP